MELSRRIFFKGIAGAAFAAAGGTKAALPRPGPRIPGEWEKTEAIWLSADVVRPEFMDASARLIQSLADTVPLRLLVTDAEAASAALEGFGQRGVPMSQIPIFKHPDVGFFIREAAQFVVDSDGRKGVLDLSWNEYGMADWCARHLYPDNPGAAQACADYASRDKGVVDHWFAEHTAASLLSVPLVLEGGAYEVNGHGTMLVGEHLAMQRNRGKTRDELEQIMLSMPGIRKVIWLQEGLAEDPHMMGTITGQYVGLGTGGHTDEYVRFADPRTILLAWIEDHEIDEHPLNAINRERMERNFAILSRATDQDGRPFRIIKLPLPRIIEREEVLVENSADQLAFTTGSFPTSEGRQTGDRVTRVAAASYLNYLVVNDVVILPTYLDDGTTFEVENKVRDIFTDAFAGRTVKFVDVTAFNWGGGGIHCATLSEMQA